MPKLSEIVKYRALGAATAATQNALRSSYPGVFAETDKVDLVDPNTFIGVEVEVENVGDMRGTDFMNVWQTKPDGSLRNGGLEFVSFPMKGKMVAFSLEMLFKDLPKRARFSQRTSIHVHTDVRGLTPEELAKNVLVYLTVESQLFDFAGEERESNIFCVPWYSIGFTDSIFNNIKRLERGEGVRGIQGENNRYSALNLVPVTSFGTIEYRHLGGTRDISRILTWINLILSIRTYALSKSLDELIKEIIDLNTNSQYRAYAQRVFGDLFYKFANFGSVDKKIEMGVISVKRALFSDTFLNELKGDFSKSFAMEILTELKGMKSTKTASEAALAALIRGEAPEWELPREEDRLAERAIEDRYIAGDLPVGLYDAPPVNWIDAAAPQPVGEQIRAFNDRMQQLYGGGGQAVPPPAPVAPARPVVRNRGPNPRRVNPFPQGRF